MTKSIKIAILTVIALCVYFGFDAYLVALAIFFTLKWALPLLFIGMVMINLLGLIAYDYFDEDLLHLEEGKAWIERKDGKHEAFKKMIRKTRWFAFLALSIWPCPLAGYLYLRDKTNESFLDAVVLIVIGSIPGTLVWGTGTRGIWVYKLYAIPIGIAAYVVKKLIDHLKSKKGVISSGDS